MFVKYVHTCILMNAIMIMIRTNAKRFEIPRNIPRSVKFMFLKIK